jgi:hypothetical protein
MSDAQKSENEFELTIQCSRSIRHHHERAIRENVSEMLGGKVGVLVEVG